MRLRAAAPLGLIATLIVVLSTAAGGTARAASYATISGAGSSWQSPALLQWGEDLAANGVSVNYLPDGNDSGRANFAQGGLVDFAASDEPFRHSPDELAGLGSEHVPWSYSYLPAVGGGVAFAYHLSVGGRPVKNLRLSAATLSGIFTGTITNWDDPSISRDNGRRLPSLPIIPVVNSGYAGSTFYFTDWLAHRFGKQWDAFCRKVHPGIKEPCGNTEFYPRFGNAKPETGSTAVVSYITSKYGQGSIGYVESSYVLFDSHASIARIANASGHYVLPDPLNETYALEKAVVNGNPASPNYLQENLAPVYTDKNPAAYPISYYGYLIVPRNGKVPPVFTKAAGRTLSTLVDFAVCQGQLQAAPLGYAPLPRNLVAAALKQIANIPGHVGIPSLAACHGKLPY